MESSRKTAANPLWTQAAVISRLWNLVQEGARGRFLVLLVIMAVSGPVELAGIGITAELMGLVASQGKTLSHGPLGFLLEYQGVVDPTTRLKDGLLWAILALALVNGYAVMKSYFRADFVCVQEAEVSTRLFRSCINQPYIWFLQRNTGDLHRLISSGGVTQLLLNSFISAIAKLAVALTLSIALAVAEPMAALIALLVVCIAYAVVRFFTKEAIRNKGGSAHADDSARRVTAQEALTSIRFVKTTAREDFFVKRYSHFADKASRGMVFHSIYVDTVRAFLEWVAFGCLLTMSIAMVLQADSMETILPRLTLFTMAGYRVIPAVHELFGLWTSFRFHSRFLDELEELMALEPVVKEGDLQSVQGLSSSPNLIQLKDVAYSYPGTEREVLADVSLQVSKGEWLGVVGPTGAGKTTILDLMSGLCFADRGTVTVGESVLDSSIVKDWQSKIGVVPQEVILLDESLMRNVAFGVLPEDIDQDLVREVVRLAGLEELLKKMPEGLETRLGERGTRLSGGERQRVGLARALYRKPSLLLLDEATSALDQETEARIIETLQNLSKDCTLVTVAHRLSSVKPCDSIIVLEDGKLVAQGSFDELLEKSRTFQRLALVS